MASIIAEHVNYQGDSGSLTQDAAGYHASLVFLVGDLSGDAAARHFDALSPSEIPNYGDQHPAISSIYVSNREVQLLDHSSAVVRVTYGPRSAVRDANANATIEYGGGLVEVDTNLDRLGELMTVPYNDEEQTGTVKKSVQNSTIIVSQTESQSPAEKIKNYNGKLNSQSFSIDGQEYFSGDLLLSISASSANGGETWNVTYTFQNIADDYKATVAYIDPETDAPPSDATLGNGLAEYEIYHYANFNDLGLRL